MCEDCGYPLSGLDPTGACPECGRLIDASLPKHRAGPAWLDRPSLWYWLEYARGALWTTAADRRSIRIDESAARRLLTMNVRLATAPPALAGLLWLAWRWFVVPPTTSGALDRRSIGLLALPLVVLLVAPTLRLLTLIERRGIRFFGARHGWRISREVAWSVCAHASVAWVVATMLATLALLSGPIAARLASGGGSLTLAYWAPIGLAPIAFGIGMVWFECLVFMGVRSCRFANRPDAR